MSKLKAEAKPLSGPLPKGGATGATVSVEPLLGGEVQVPRAFFENPGGRFAKLRTLGVGTPRSKYVWAPVPAFLVTHPTAGPFLVDTAFHSSVAAKPAANLGRAMAWASKARVEPGRTISAQLRERGIDSKQLGLVVLTHMHFDHTSGIAEYPAATFVVSQREWEHATTDDRPLLHGYNPAHFDYLFDYRTIDFDGALITSYANSFGRTFDLFGDGSVRLAYTPGHTPGHCSVICRLNDRDLVIAGDAIYTRAQLDGADPPPAPADMHKWKRSLRELQQFARTYPRAVIVPGHDADDWPTLEKRYE
ncbi:MAG: N-acyl homoserine lactonase family protein [Thermoleophilales bacterium]|nr:N-acyl homoserine lactonase family protein [Solirubrobacterales bacterium]MCB8969295.1 N-acyl homoserine lactonase family protein [Thermoleophilales bacterium]